MTQIVISINCILITAVVAFALGAYYQHNDALKRLEAIIATDPYAFHIRDKLYDVLRIFKCSVECSRKGYTLERIMKYGFPGLDDLRLYENFVISYDRRNRVAHWVYEHLDSETLTTLNGATVSRRNADFQADFNIPSDFRVYKDDYKGTGFDRGHLAAAANYKNSQAQCNETFYLTNIAPQVGPGFNRDAWQKLENYVRNLCRRYGSVFVCTGPLYLPHKTADGKWCVEYQVLGPKYIAVPTHYFKVITVESKLPNGLPYMEAYVMPNIELDKNVNIRSFLRDIRDIEYASGLKFFQGLRRSYFFSTNYPTDREVYTKFH